MDEGGVSKAPLQYGNEFLRQGQYFTWFIDVKRWQSEHGNLAKIIRSTRQTGNMTSSCDKKESNSSFVHLFARQGHMAYLYCGRCRLISEEEPSSRRNLFKLTFELLDYHNESESLATTTATAFTSTTSRRYLIDSTLYRTMVSTHVEEMRQVSYHTGEKMKK